MINQIELINFRCHKQKKFENLGQKTAFIGQNGAGKTSFLEAIYYVCRGKSFRDSDLDLIKNNQEFLRIKANFDFKNNHDRIIKIKNNYQKKDKIIEINQQKSKILKQQYKIPVVLFEPDNLNLISGSPARRRKFIDELISQYNNSHNLILNRYNKTLKQRNDLIKKMLNLGKVESEKLFSWNVLLSQYGGKIIKNRIELVDKINQEINQIYQQITDKKDNILLNYSYQYQDKNLIEQELFNQLISQDYFQNGTIIGPHRDDLEIYFNQKLASKICSRGENRSLILSLKIIENEIIKQELNINPIILLDDVLSELDENRQKHLMNYTNNSQIFLTSNNVNNLSDYQIINL